MNPIPVQCVDCVHFDLRRFAGMAKLGYGTCGLDKRTGRYQSAVFERHCDGFTPASAEVAARRRQWLDEQQKKFHDAIERSKTT